MRFASRRHFTTLLVAWTGALGLPGCIIDAPEELSEPARLPPRAVLDDALPPLNQVVQTSGTREATEFRVRYVSDDLGQPILGRLYLDYGTPVEKYLVGTEDLAGTLDSPPRYMVIPWTANRSQTLGCHTITMTISHADNYDRETLKPIEDSETAFITWWIVHELEPQDVSFDECAVPLTPTP